MSDINVKRFRDASGRQMVSIAGALCPPVGGWLDQFKRSRDEAERIAEMAAESIAEDDGPEIRRKKFADAQKEFVKRKRREQLALVLEDSKEIRAAFCPPAKSSDKDESGAGLQSNWTEIAGFKVTMNYHKKPRERGHPWMFYELLYVEPSGAPKQGA